LRASGSEASAPRRVGASRDRGALDVYFPPTSVSQGWMRFVRFQEIERTQQMADMGAKQSVL
jgi:hypothetical protein